MSPTILAYMGMRQIMGAKLSGNTSSLVTDMFSKIDLDHHGILERDEIRYGYLWCAMRFCVWFTRFRLAHSQYIRSFLAGSECEDDEMKDAKKHAEHLNAAVNDIFEVKML